MLNDMKRSLLNNKKRLPSKIMTFLLAVLFFLLASGGSLKAQDRDYHIGVRGGFGMTTLSGFQNNGLRLGLVAGVYGKYIFSENSSIIADINYSTGGQQSERWISGELGEVKVYSKYSLHYINTPILYQYYFTDILGLEGGLDFRYRIGSSLKSKVGNEGWHKTHLDSNGFDCGLIFGVYTDNLIPHDNFFVSLRAYFGFLDVVKEVGANKNVSVQVTVGYMIF